MVKIALDAGHGINTPGKRTPDDEREWSFNNKVLLACADKLKEYENVEILRLDDSTGKTDVPLNTRTDKANNWKADVLVSIHHNANTAQWGNWGGVETFIQTGASKASRDIANIIHPLIVKAMGLRDRGLKTSNLHMTRSSNMPSLLTEGGFMDSTTDIGALRSNDKLKAQGEAIAEGLATHFKLKPKANKPVNIAQNPKPTTPNTPPKGDITRMFSPSSATLKNEMIKMLELAKEMGVISSDVHVDKVRKGELTLDDATALLSAVLGRHLKEEKEANE